MEISKGLNFPTLESTLFTVYLCKISQLLSTTSEQCAGSEENTPFDLMDPENGPQNSLGINPLINYCCAP